MKNVPKCTRPAERAAQDARHSPDYIQSLIEDKPPWPQSVAGNDLLDAMTEALRTHVVAPLPCLQATALWALYSHAFASLPTSPLLAFVSPQKRCGKTSALTALSFLVRRPLGVSNITPAALYRAIDKWQPTLLIDEADTFMTSQEELRGIINSGHRRHLARVVRSIGDRHEPHAFSTWCPKVIARIGTLSSTLADRAIIVPLRRKRPAELVHPLNAPALARLQVLGQQAARWASDQQDQWPATRLDIAGLDDRARDNWSVLHQIALAAGRPWPQICGDTALYFAQTTQVPCEDDIGTTLLDDIRRSFHVAGQNRLSSRQLAQMLAQMEHRPWPEWRSYRPITPRQIAQLLAPYRIGPKTVRLGDANTPKGYDLDQFSDAFARYLPAFSATPPQDPLT